jgi:hypothetical protein
VRSRSGRVFDISTSLSLISRVTSQTASAVLARAAHTVPCPLSPVPCPRIRSALHNILETVNTGTSPSNVDVRAVVSSAGITESSLNVRRLCHLLADLANGDHHGIISFWASSEATMSFAGLSDVAMCILGIVPSTAATERSFSYFGICRDKIRNRMSFRTMTNRLKVSPWYR